MTVSFVIPNYNHARYVRFAIDSALAQTDPDTEVIVVDDGSTDNSRTVLAGYGDRIRPIYQANAGLSAARNSGIKAATGEWIALLDADDMVEPAYVERLLAALAAQPQAQGAYCGFRYIDQDNRPLPRVEQRVVAPAALHDVLLDGNAWVPASFVVRRDCYLAMGEFDTSLRACEDWDVWLRFSRHYILVGIPDVLVRYRVVAGSMSSSPQRMLDNRLAVLDKHLGEQPAEAGASAAHRVYANAYLRTAIEWFQAGNSAAGYDRLRDAASLFPPLLCVHATYYELACSGQERGSEGDLELLDVNQQQRILEGLIERLAGDPALRAQMQEAGIWRSQALWAIAQMHYRKGDGAAARAVLRNALRQNPALLRQRSFTGLLARTFVRKDRLTILKRMLGR